MRRRDVLTAVVVGAAMELTDGLAQSEHSPAREEFKKTNPGDTEVLYFGNWTEIRDQGGQGYRRSNMPYHACEFAFTGPLSAGSGQKDGTTGSPMSMWMKCSSSLSTLTRPRHSSLRCSLNAPG